MCLLEVIPKGVELIVVYNISASRKGLEAVLEANISSSVYKHLCEFSGDNG